jgi:hypothetical protein
MQPYFSYSQSQGLRVDIPRGDRWRIHHRLKELTIPAHCPADGSLRVEVNDGIALLLVRSTIQQFIAPKQELVDWLERCWTTPVECHQYSD